MIIIPLDTPFLMTRWCEKMARAQLCLFGHLPKGLKARTISVSKNLGRKIVHIYSTMSTVHRIILYNIPRRQCLRGIKFLV